MSYLTFLSFLLSVVGGMCLGLACMTWRDTHDKAVSLVLLINATACIYVSFVL